MRLLGPICAALVMMMPCSPAAADCMLYKLLIVTPNAKPTADAKATPDTKATPDAKDAAPEITARYEIRDKIFSVVVGAERRTGRLRSLCEGLDLILYEENTPDKDDGGICWLTIGRDAADGLCFHKTGVVKIMGKLY